MIFIPQNKIDRIEGIIKTQSLDEFKASIRQITEDMLEDGFDVDEVYEYMTFEIQNYLKSITQ